MMMSGPPGSGKTLISRSMPGILPLRLLHRPRKRMYLLQVDGQELPKENIRPVGINGLDRYASRVEVPHVAFDKLSDKRTGESSAAVREGVEAARAIQRERFEETDLRTDSDMGPAEIRQFCPLDEASTNPVKATMQQMQMSVRVYYRILKLTRTIADLAKSEDIQTPHIAESIQYRPRRQV